MNAIHPRLLTLLLNDAGIPGKVRGQSLADLRTDKAATALVQHAEAFVDGLRDRYISPVRPADAYPEDRSKIGVGMLLSGPPGTGKTTLAAVTAQEIFLRYRLRVKFTAFADVMAAKVEQIRLDAQVRAGVPDAVDRFWKIDEWMTEIRETPVLVLDDVGKERQTGSGYAEDEFDMLVRERFRNMRPTIVTTNLKAEEWASTYNPSMASFIAEAFDDVQMIVKDRRRARR